MAGSRANWEGMLESVTNKISETLKSSSQEKAELAGDSLGTGMADRAANDIKKNNKHRKAMEDAGLE
jgi:hypothetical protein